MRQSSVDLEPANGFQILKCAHDHVWNEKKAWHYKDRFEATDLLWKLAIQTLIQ